MKFAYKPDGSAGRDQVRLRKSNAGTCVFLFPGHVRLGTQNAHARMSLVVFLLCSIKFLQLYFGCVGFSFYIHSSLCDLVSICMLAMGLLRPLSWTAIHFVPGVCVSLSPPTSISFPSSPTLFLHRCRLDIFTHMHKHMHARLLFCDLDPALFRSHSGVSTITTWKIDCKSGIKIQESEFLET